MTDNCYYQPTQRIPIDNPYMYCNSTPGFSLIYNVPPTFPNYNDLCSCCENDCSVCIRGFCCPICMNTSLSYKIANNGKRTHGLSLFSIPFSCTAFYNRRYINHSYGVVNSNCNDCLTTIFCYPCSVVQNENNYTQLFQQKQSV